jgi:hypothetical protein
MRQERITPAGPNTYELFSTAIRTFPLQPNRGDIRLVAAGIVPDLDRKEHNQDETFFEDCKRANVIPGSSMEFTYNPNKEMFIHDKGIFLSTYGYPGVNTEMYRAVLTGSRPHSLTFQLGLAENAAEAFEIFRHATLGEFQSFGYQPYSGNLWIIPEDKNHMSGIMFSAKPKDPRLSLEVSPEFPPQNSQALEIWFKHLPKT